MIDHLEDLPDMDGLTLADKERILSLWYGHAHDAAVQMNETIETLTKAKADIERREQAVSEQEKQLAQIAKTLEDKSAMLQWPIWCELLSGKTLEALQSMTQPGESPADVLIRMVNHYKKPLKFRKRQ